MTVTVAEVTYRRFKAQILCSSGENATRASTINQLAYLINGLFLLF